MPNLPINYDKTHFYKLCCTDPTITDIYVGHTTDFTRRRHVHKTDCCNEKSKNHNTYTYKFIRDNQGWDNWDMVLIETLKCDDVLHARKTERGFIEQLSASLNSVIPSRTVAEQKKQYREINKERLAQYHKEQKKTIS